MIEEGFSEKQMVSAILSADKVIESYEEDQRCLLLGYVTFDKTARSPLHIVCDYSNGKVVDIVTAYIPQKPWWITPHQRGKK